jgi:hypothetical protein
MINQIKKDLKISLKKKDPDLIILGETHGFLQDNLIQEEIIKNFNPNILVYEMLEEEKLLTKKDQENFLRQKNSRDFSVISKYKELKSTIELARKYKIPIIGNDIKNMCRKNKKFLNKKTLTKKELKNEQRILEKREKRQIKIIKDLLKKKKKILVTTGAYHLRKSSPLLNINKDYLIIYPIYENKQLFSPPKKFDVKKVSWKIKRISEK